MSEMSVPTSTAQNQKGDLAKQGLSALKWSYLGTVVKAVSQLAVGIILARLLGPEPFGVVAIAWLVIGVCNLVADFGFGAVLIQRETLVERDIRFVFTCQVALGGAFTLIGVFASNMLAVFFHKPEAGTVLQAMFCIFVLQSLGQTSVSLLRRALDFKRLQALAVGSYLSGYVLVGIPTAVLGGGAWSLVFATLSQTVFMSIGAMVMAPVTLRPAFSAASPGIFRFGFKVIGANLSSWGLTNIDSFVVGRMLGVLDLGYYNRAMMLVMSPMYALSSSFQSVLFAAASRAQNDRTALARAYLGTSAIVGLFCLPVFVTVAVVPKAVVLGLYGPAWLPAAPVLAPLSLAMAVNVLLAVVGPLLMSIDKVALELKAQTIALVVLIPLLYFAVKFSLVGVAWAMFAIACMRWLLLATAIAKELGLPWLAGVRTLTWPAGLAVLVALPAVALDHFMVSVAPLLHLLCVVMMSGAILLACLLLLGGRILRSALGNDEVFLQVALPAGVRRLLRV